MKNDQIELRVKVEKYMRDRYRIYVGKDGETIRFGRAIFPVKMLIDGSISVCQANPEKDTFEIVEYMFDYYCT